MIHLEIPRRLWLNANDREHWAARSRKVKELRMLGRNAARGMYPFDRAEINVRVGWPDNRRRDDANYHPTYKALVDGMVDGGLIPDDSRDHLVGPFPRSYTAGVRDVMVLDFHIQEVAQ